jgi:WD40 repeat protein
MTGGPVLSLLSLAAALCALAPVALAAERLHSVPLPQVETGMHVGAIRALHVNLRAGIAATTGDDKTVRLWRYASFRLLNTLRLPSGPGPVGRALGVALHPRMRVAAVVARAPSTAGAAVSLLLFETESGEILRASTPMPGSDARVAFSSDGSTIAVAANGATFSVRAFRAQDLAPLAEDRSFAAPIVELKAAAPGRFVAATADGELRLYGPALERLQARSLAGAGPPLALAVSEDGARVAVSFGGRPRIEVLAGADLRPLYAVDTSPLAGRPPLAALAWEGSGDELYGAEQGGGAILRWQQAGRARPVTFARADERVALVAAAGGFVVAVTDPAGFRVFEASGRMLGTIRPPIADFRDIGGALRAGPNAEIVQYPLARGGRNVAAFSLETTQLVGRRIDPRPASPAAQTLVASLGDWRSTGTARMRGVPLALDPGERMLSVVAAPDGARLFVGTDSALRVYDANGRALRAQPVDAAVLGVAVAPEGELVVAAHADGTIRWYGAADGEERMALFPHANGVDWMLWNNSGYYMSSPFGDGFLGWHVNNQPGEAPSFYTARQFERTLYRPDILDCTARCFGLRKKWRPDKGQPEGVAFVSQFRPPRIRIERVEPVQTPAGPTQYRVRFRVDAVSLPVTDYSVYVNNVPVVPLRDRQVEDGAQFGFEKEFVIALPERVNTLRIEAFNGRTLGFVERAVEVDHPSPRPARGNLHLVAIGVDAFPNLPKQFQLAYAARDAEALVEHFQTRARANFDQVNVRLITDNAAAKPTRDNILEALASFSEAAGNDTVVLYLASHAVSDKAGNYFFAPREVKLADLRALEGGKAEGEASAIAWIRFIDALRTAAGKRILIVDTCRAAAIQGKSDLFTLQKRSAAARFAILTASKGDELSMEYAAAKHGLFTYTLLQGLTGQADRDRNRSITLQELYEFIVPTVERLRPDRRISQTPQLVAPDPLGRAVFVWLGE